MEPSRAEQQLKEEVFRICKSLSGFLKQLRPGATRQALLKAIPGSWRAYETLIDSMNGASPSCLQFYLDYAVPAKMWGLAVCLLQLLNTEEAAMQELVSAGVYNCLLSMLRLNSLLPEGLRAAAWEQMLPVAEDGKQGTQAR